jgi:alkanesulfonate monooxygenase SsuD/methylene tetrahydromethanopterin reductase-like flavin-dependent oxidoreductase (luciferase family)
VKLGAHLPLADLGEGLPTASGLQSYAAAARDLGYATLAANDHLLWRHPWLDGPMALACVAASAGVLTLATSITLPVVRHPVVVAKMLTSLAAMAQGPVVAGLGPGSSAADYAAVGVPFSERWARFDEAFRLVRALVRGEPADPGSFYPVEARLAPLPAPPPEVWFGSWGSDRRLAAMAAVADGWFASAYNATPGQFALARDRLDDHLRTAGREPDEFPHAVATTWLYVTDDRQQAERMLTDVLAPTVGRDPATLAHLPIGSPEHCAQALAAYEAAGVQELVLWPLGDGIRQLERARAAAGSV